MNKLYDKAFKVGVWFNVFAFTILNVVSYLIAYREHIRFMNMEIQFDDPVGFPYWGFPFFWRDQCLGLFQGDTLILNGVVIVFCGFVLGFLFKFIWAKKRGDISML